MADSSVTLAAATVGTVLPARVGPLRRVAFSITNTGANVAYICLSSQQTAVSGSGIELLPGSQMYDSDGGDYRCFTGQVTAVSAAGTTLAVMERVNE